MKTKTALAILTFFTLLCSTQAFGQSSIVGKVTDKRTGEPLLDVKVYWLGIHESDKELTNEEGIYQIPYDSRGILVFELSGKKRLFVEVNDELLERLFYEIDVKLEDQEVSASTASHWEQSVFEIPASTVIISREEIERNGYMTLNDILENVPGFYTIDHRSESDITVGVRGFWAPFNRNVLIQVNGVNMLSERQNDFPLNKINVPVESIERVEIIRGPLSVIYGAGAFFGVINIITLNPVGEEVSGHFSAGFGSQNTYQQNFQYHLHKDGLLLSLHAMNHVRDGFEQPWDAMITDSLYNLYAQQYSSVAPFDTTTADMYQGSIVNPERYSRQHQSVNMAMRYNNFSANLNYAHSNFGFSFLHPGPSDRNDYRSNTINVQFGYRGESQEFSKYKDGGVTQFSYEIKAAHMFSLVDATYKYFLSDSYTPGEDRVASLRGEANTLWTIYNNEEKNRSLLFSSGIAYTNNYQNNSIYNAAEFGLRNWYIGLAPNTSLETKSFYSQANAKFNRLSFIAGGRLEQQGAYEMLSSANQDYNFVYTSDTTSNGNPIYDTVSLAPSIVHDTNSLNDQLNFIPRLAVIYKLSKQDTSAHYLRLMYGGAIKQSSVVDNASDVMLSYDGPNRPYLKPERITTYEIGYTYNFVSEDYQRRERKALMVNVNGFRNDLSDLITRNASIINGSYVTRSINGDELITNGVELITDFSYSIPRSEGQKSMIARAKGNITYQKTVDQANPDIPVSFSPNLLAGANLAFEIEAPRKLRQKAKVRKIAYFSKIGLNGLGF